MYVKQIAVKAGSKLCDVKKKINEHYVRIKKFAGEIFKCKKHKIS